MGLWFRSSPHANCFPSRIAIVVQRRTLAALRSWSRSTLTIKGKSLLHAVAYMLAHLPAALSINERASDGKDRHMVGSRFPECIFRYMRLHLQALSLFIIPFRFRLSVMMFRSLQLSSVFIIHENRRWDSGKFTAPFAASCITANILLLTALRWQGGVTFQEPGTVPVYPVMFIFRRPSAAGTCSLSSRSRRRLTGHH